MINSVYRLIAPGMIEVACTQPDIKNSVLLRPVYLSVCKADQRYYLGNRSREALKAKLPMALIHECVAKVVFDPTDNFKPGEIVVPVPNTPTEDDDIIAENYRDEYVPFYSEGNILENIPGVKYWGVDENYNFCQDFSVFGSTYTTLIRLSGFCVCATSNGTSLKSTPWQMFALPSITTTSDTDKECPLKRG